MLEMLCIEVRWSFRFLMEGLPVGNYEELSEHTGGVVQLDHRPLCIHFLVKYVVIGFWTLSSRASLCGTTMVHCRFYVPYFFHSPCFSFLICEKGRQWGQGERDVLQTSMNSALRFPLTSHPFTVLHSLEWEGLNDKRGNLLGRQDR